MAERDCNSEDCEAHVYMVEAIKELRITSGRLLDNQQTLELTVVRITENLNELKKTNNRIDDILHKQDIRDKEVDTALEAQSAFTNRALGAIAVISFFLPIGLFLLGIILKS